MISDDVSEGLLPLSKKVPLPPLQEKSSPSSRIELPPLSTASKIKSGEFAATSIKAGHSAASILSVTSMKAGQQGIAGVVEEQHSSDAHAEIMEGYSLTPVKKEYSQVQKEYTTTIVKSGQYKVTTTHELQGTSIEGEHIITSIGDVSTTGIRSVLLKYVKSVSFEQVVLTYNNIVMCLCSNGFGIMS